MHLISENSSIAQFNTLLNNTDQNNMFSDYTFANIQSMLNAPVTSEEPYKTPLYFSYPNVELADLLISKGADPHQLSFLHCYFTYRK